LAQQPAAVTTTTIAAAQSDIGSTASALPVPPLGMRGNLLAECCVIRHSMPVMISIQHSSVPSSPHKTLTTSFSYFVLFFGDKFIIAGSHEGRELLFGRRRNGLSQ
jgi:hypothetical protein